MKYGSYQFTSFISFSNWNPKNVQGLYALAHQTGTDNNTTYYKTLYFGQTKNFNNREWSEHKGVKCCLNKLPEGRKLRIAIYETPNWTEEQRKKLETQLIKSNNPSCNKMLST